MEVKFNFFLYSSLFRGAVCFRAQLSHAVILRVGIGSFGISVDAYALVRNLLILGIMTILEKLRSEILRPEKYVVPHFACFYCHFFYRKNDFD